MKTRLRACWLVLFVVAAIATYSSIGYAAPSDESDVRNLVQRVFDNLKAGKYNELFDLLPGAVQKRTSRAQFTAAMERAREVYDLDKIEISSVKVLGDMAVVETAMSGRIHKPVENEGKIVAQQYLIRENGAWRVASGDNATIQKFLASNPSFARKFPMKKPRIFVKADGKWVELIMPQRQRKN